MKKVFKVIRTLFNVSITILVLLFVLVVCLQRFSNNQLSIFSYRMFTVVSGSMEPKYTIGDVLIAREINPSDVKVGDAVSYLGSVGEFKDKVVTHEVIEIEKTENGKFKFHTKGIANLVEDPVISEDQLYGKVIYKTVILSFIYSVVSKPFGMFIFVLLPIMYIIVSEIVITLVEKEGKRRGISEDKE